MTLRLTEEALLEIHYPVIELVSPKEPGTEIFDAETGKQKPINLLFLEG